MRILQVVPTYLPARRYGGPIVAVHGLARALTARGHDVTVFTTNVDGTGVSDVAIDRPTHLDGVEIHYFQSSVPRIYYSPPMSKALMRSVGDYDIVHSHAVFLWPGVAAAREARRAGRPYMISPRGMLVPELIRAKSRILKLAWLRLVERSALSRADAFHFTSELERSDADRTGLVGRPSYVVPNGVDLAPVPDVKRENDLLLYLGRISWKKGLDRLIPLLRELPHARLIVAGNDDEGLIPHLSALAAQAGVGARVTFPGPVYGEAKNELLARAAVFLLPSHSENFGNTVLEALAMKTPVALSSTVGLADVVASAGAGVVGLDQVAELLRNGERRRQMGDAGRLLVESEFAWPQVAARMESVYAEIIARREGM